MSDPTVRLRPPYPIRYRTSFREAWDALRADHGDRPWLVVADRRVLERQPAALVGLGRAERRRVVTLRGGESCKGNATLRRLERAALERGLGRDGLVVAVGGGSIGDVVGFFAATWMRGVRWCPLATTVLSLADSAVGGKTAVNVGGVKNLVGAFHQPVGVYGALEALGSLPRRQRASGLAEVVKSGWIGDASLVRLLERHGDELGDPRSPVWEEAVRRACAVKAEVVAADPREQGRRAVLNFGHTLGHALEALCRPRLLHGEAVALGMIAATSVSEELGLASEGVLSRLIALLGALGILREPQGCDEPSIWEIMRYDKKAEGGALRMVLTRGVGRATIGHAVERRMLRRALQVVQRRAASAP